MCAIYICALANVKGRDSFLTLPTMTAISMKYVFLGCVGLAVLVGFWVSRRIRTVSDLETEFVVPQTSDNMDAFVGEWVLETNDNFDAVLKELGKIQNGVTP